MRGLVANGVLGGGYSSRLNQEIRIKRGLSYGAGSSLSPRGGDRRLHRHDVQTKNESAAQVVGPDQGRDDPAWPPSRPRPPNWRRASRCWSATSAATWAPRAAWPTSWATWRSTASRCNEIQAYTGKVEAVSAADVQAFSRAVLDPGQTSVIVVGDAKTMGESVKTALPGAGPHPDRPTGPRQPHAEEGQIVPLRLGGGDMPMGMSPSAGY